MKPKEVVTVCLDPEDAEERMARAAHLLAEGVLAHLKKLGLLGPEAAQAADEAPLAEAGEPESTKQRFPGQTP